MSLMSDLNATLAADAGVIAQTTRIYDNRAPQSPRVPYLVLTEISAVRYPHTQAAGGLVTKRVQVDIYAASTTSMRVISELVRDALDGRRGTLGSTVVRSCYLDSETEQYEPPTDGSSGGRCRKIQEYLVTHTESVPTF